MADLQVTDADLRAPEPLDSVARPLNAPELLEAVNRPEEARPLRSLP